LPRKGPPERFQSARDLAFALSALATPSGTRSAADTAPAANSVKNRGRFIAAGALLASFTAAAVVVGPIYRAAVTPFQQPLVTFTIAPPAGTTLANVPSKMLAISPDGERIVFAVERAGQRELWMRRLASAKSEPLPGTQGASEPFWSPDGQHVGFFADSKLKRVGVDGTTPLTLCDTPPDARGGTVRADRGNESHPLRGDVCMGKLTDRVAIVTGASKGIGRGIATALAAAGARVV
jgi:hypothetical protein